jgi:uncharacterized membrane protein
MLGAMAAIAVLTFITENAGLLKVYPVLVNLLLLVSFGYTLFHGPTMIFRFALLQDKKIVDSPKRKSIETYCRIVTIIWCAVFMTNVHISAATILLGDMVWSVYNGFVSYVLIGMLILGELIFRKLKYR